MKISEFKMVLGKANTFLVRLDILNNFNSDFFWFPSKITTSCGAVFLTTVYCWIFFLGSSLEGMVCTWDRVHPMPFRLVSTVTINGEASGAKSGCPTMGPLMSVSTMSFISLRHSSVHWIGSFPVDPGSRFSNLRILTVLAAKFRINFLKVDINPCTWATWLLIVGSGHSFRIGEDALFGNGMSQPLDCA